MDHDRGAPPPAEGEAPVDVAVSYAQRTGSLVAPDTLAIELDADGENTSLHHRPAEVWPPRQAGWELPSPAFEGILRPPVEAGLSFREQEVLALVGRGFSNKEIGDFLHIKERTVKTHLQNVTLKLQTGDRTQLARMTYGIEGEIPHEAIQAFGLVWREAQVAEMVALGNSNEAIGAALYLSVNTVKTHISRAMAKTGARNRTNLMTILYGYADSPKRRIVRSSDT
jgi:DNA-binding NarL/FixJ family response regulator